MNKCAVAGMVSLALAGIAQTAAAQDSDAKSDSSASAWYIGAGFGQTFASIPDQTVDGINSVLSAANGATSTVIDKDKHSSEAKVFVGYTFNPYLAVEGGFASLGDSRVNMNFLVGNPVSSSVGGFNLKYSMSAAFVDAVGMFPVTDKWTLIGRLGVSYNRVTTDFNGSPTTFIISSNDENETKVNAKFGAGVDYKVNHAFTARVEWERYKMPDPLSDEQFYIDTATLSLLYRF